MATERDILVAAEKALVQMAAERAARRDYDGASMALGLAREQAAMLARITAPATDANEFAEGQSPATSSAASPSGAAATKDAAARRNKKTDYPKFYRTDDVLVKVGYSKQEGKYEHRAPKEALLTLARTLIVLRKEKRQITMNDALSLLEGRDAPPSYQLYMCLNWLKFEGLVDQHGRQGYTFDDKGDWLNQLLARWEQLPKAVPE